MFQREFQWTENSQYRTDYFKRMDKGNTDRCQTLCVRLGTVRGKRTREEYEDGVAEVEEEEKGRKKVEHIHAEEDLVEKEDGTVEEGMAKCRK